MLKLAPLALTVLALGYQVFAFVTPTIPLGWNTQVACAVDTPSRILLNDHTTQYADNSPANCVTRCAAAGYDYAGVEYSNECHCGTGLVGTPTGAPISDCNQECSGNSTLSCGAGWRIQIYSAPDASSGFGTPTLPDGWSTVYACAIDNGARIISHDHITAYSNNTPAGCVNSCIAAGFNYAGVEYGNECHCGTGIVGHPPTAPTSDCNVPCAGDPSLSCGGSWRIQVYKSRLLQGSWTYQGCYVDTPTTPALTSPITYSPASNLDLVWQCNLYCANLGYPWWGVEAASECKCSTSLAAGATIAPQGECNLTVPLPGNAGNEYAGGVQRMGVFKYTG